MKNLLFGKKFYNLLLLITVFNIVYFTLRGEYYLNIVLLFSFLLAYLIYRAINKNASPYITLILFVANMTTYLVMYFMSIRMRRMLIIEGADGSTAVGMDSTSIQDKINDQEEQKKSLVDQINQIYLDNAAQISSLQKTLNDAKTLQAQQGSTGS